MIASENRALRTVPHLLANSQAITAELEQQAGLSIRSRTLRAVHGCLPVSSRPLAKKRGQILFVGRFEHRKGIDIALKAVAKAVAARPDLHAVFVGGVALPPALADLAAPLLANGQLSLRGVVSRETLDDYYRTSEIALLPSRFESFGLVAIEAMSAGCVVLSLDVGGVAEVVENGRTGILVPPNAHADAALGEAIVALMANDVALSTMRQAALDSYDTRFTVDVMAQEVESAMRTFTIRDRELRA